MINNLKKIQTKLNKIRLKKKIVLCHGVFDLVHLGHIKHFKSAKKFGDFLIVSITTNKFINKGPGRPIFDQNQRLEYLKELKIIDEVIISNKESAEDVIKIVKPDFYVKGPDYKINSKDKTQNIKKEKTLVERYGGKIKYTADLTFSSSNIINTSNYLFTAEQKKFINKLKKNFSYVDIANLISKFRTLKVLIVGELIIDRYCFGEIIGKSGKEPHLVLSKKKEDCYLGGTGAIARHISSFVNKINLISPFGKEKFFMNIINRSLKSNVKLHLFKPNENFKTIEKTRFVDQISNYKLFGSYVLPEGIVTKLSNRVIKLANKIKSQYDMILICDYGHHFLTKSIINNLKNKRKFISVNAQINAANIGYHTVDKYSGVESVVINENELRQELRDKISDIKLLAKRLISEKKIKNLIVTRGKDGAILMNKNFKVFYCPAFAKKSIDKVGAGDAMLSVTSLCLKMKINPELTLFLGSIAAAMSVESIGNKNNISIDKIDRTLEYMFK